MNFFATSTGFFLDLTDDMNLINSLFDRGPWLAGRMVESSDSSSVSSHSLMSISGTEDCVESAGDGGFGTSRWGD